MTRDIPERESLTVEFKSDRARLADRDLIAAVICLANTEGGEIYLGVEDDGRVTGLHPAYQILTGLTALIANLTSPPLTARVEAIDVEPHRIARISVPKSRQLVATSDGLLQRRRLRADGLPECVPFYPHEFAQRQSDLGLLDYSALPIPSASTQDFDPLERERLRQCVERYGGDRSLISLADDELDGALGLIRRDQGRAVPTVAGLLMLGRESALREHLPTHEVAFQVLEGTQVRVNDFYRMPLLKTFERVDEQFRARVVEPRPRNPLLADAVKRIGLAERTGRGIDLIFQGLLRYGRPAPDYRRSDSQSVVVVLPGGDADLDVLRIVIDEEKRLGHSLPIDSMIALVLLRHERRIETSRLAREIQRDEIAARKVLERLVEAGLVEAHGVKKGRTYTLSPRVYKGLGQPGDYIRQAGFDPIQQEQMVLQFARNHGKITRKEAAELCRINEDQARRLLRKLFGENKLRRTGRGRATAYEST